MKNKIAICLMILFAGISLIFSGCSVFSTTATSITVSDEVITIRLDDENENGMEVNTSTFVVTSDNFDNSHIGFRIENEGIVSYKSVRGYDNYTVIVKAVKAGQTKLIAFLAEDSTISKEIIVNVVRPIKELEVKQGYTHYIAIGQKNVIKASECFLINPIDGDLSEIRYSIISNPYNINVNIDEITGELDATNALNSGEITIRASVNESVFTDIKANVIKAVDYESFSILRKYALDSDGMMIYQNGEQFYSSIPMVKTIEFYSEISFDIIYDDTIINQTLNLISSNDCVSVQKLSEEKVVIKAVGLGKSTLKFVFSILNAEEFIVPTIIEFEVNVIEAPYDINLNGESAKSNDGVFEKAIYNRYASGSYGMAFRFTLSPSNVLEENSDITIEFSDVQKVGSSLAILNENGDKLGYDESGVNFLGIFKIKAGDTFYIKSTLSEILDYTTFTFKAIADITNTYNKGEVVSAQVYLNIYEGISELTSANSKYYIAQGSDEGATVILGTGNTFGNTSFITYATLNDNIRVEKASSTIYFVYGVKIGESSILFDSGNGYQLTIRFIIYGELTTASIKTQNQFENESIGEIEYDSNGSLSYVSAKVKGGFILDFETNTNASIGKIVYEINKAGKSFVSISNNYVSILGAGSAMVTVYIYGYNEFGIVDESEFNSVDKIGAIKRTFKVDGYIPINQIYLNVNAKELKDYTTVGFNSISKDSQLKLKLTVSPSNATIQDDSINWQVVGKYGSINTNNGYETTFTAGPIQDDDINSGVVRVVATITDKGRIYEAECVINVVKAVQVEDIKFSNVFNNEIYFDAREGLATYNSSLEIINTSNSFNIVSNIYPNNAHNKNVHYIYDGNYDTQNRPVFIVSNDGVVQPVRGGVATLKVVPDDSYIDDNTYKNSSSNLPRLIKIIVADGSSQETAYRITNAEDLIAIGTNQNSMNLYYVIANDIDLSSYPNWQPIGSLSLPFTGSLSGMYTVNNAQIKSKITGLKFNTSLESNEDAYLGLFACINLGTVKDLEIECGNISIDASGLNAKLYYGTLAGIIRNTIDDTIDNSLSFTLAKIIDCKVSSINEFNIVPSMQGNYIGGMIGFVEEGVTEISLSDDFCSINFKSITIEEDTSGVEGEIYVGGFAGLVKSQIVYDGTNLIKDYTATNIIGGYNSGANVNSQGEIIYSTYFKNSGIDVIIDNLSVSTLREAYVGGFIGYAKVETTIKENESVIKFIDKDLFEELFTISNIAVSANIKAKSVSNVGGIIGYNEYLLKETYFKGSVDADENVGGIAGVNAYLVDKAVVNFGTSDTIVGNKNVGAIVGEQRYTNIQFKYYTDDTFTNIATITLNSQLSFSYASCPTSAIVLNGNNGGTNIGTIVGLNNGDIIGCYTEIVSSSNVFVGGGNGQILCSFIIGGYLNTSSYTNCYYVYDELTNYDEEALLNATYNGNGIFVKPGTIININGESILIDASINNGKVIICKPNEFPIYNVVYTTMEISVNSTSDKFIKVSDDKVILFYYELDEEFESGLTSKDKYELRQIARNLNTINLTEIISVNMIPTPFSSVRFDFETINANGKGSPIITTNYNGSLTVNREGLAYLTITSIDNPNLKQTIEIYVQNYLSELKLYSGSNASGIELNDHENILLRKGYEKNIYAKIISNIDNVSLLNADNVGLRISIDIDDSVAYDEDYTYIDFNKLQINSQAFKVLCYIEIESEKHYATLVNGSLIFEDILPTIYKSEDGLGYGVQYNSVDYVLHVESAYIELDNVSLLAINAMNSGKSSLTLRPYINVKFSNGDDIIETQKIYLSTSRIGSRIFDVTVYEGAISIDSDIDSLVYSPSDTINFDMYLLSDNADDELEFEVLNQKYSPSNLPYLNVRIYKVDAIKLSNGNYRIIYNVSANLSTEFEARYLEEIVNYDIVFNSTLIKERQKTINLQFTPQSIQRLGILNYTSGEMMLSTSGETTKLVYNQNESSSLYIVSNSSGMLNINMYPYYSKVDVVTVQSVQVDGETINFTQLIKNIDDGGIYTTLKPYSQYLNNGDTIILQKASNIDEDGNKSFNGNFYVKTLISSEIKENTRMPIIVSAYNYDEDGNLILLKQSTIELIVKEIPFIKVELNDNSYSNYVVKGIKTDIKVTVGKTLAGQVYDAKVTILNEDGSLYSSDSLAGELNTAIYQKINQYEIISGREVYIDSLYVGIGLPTGTKIVLTLYINYEENGESKKVASELTLIVIDYLVEDVNLYSFNNESNYLRLNQLQEYEFGVDKLFFKSAPVYERAINEYKHINANDINVKLAYYTYYYGMLTTKSGEEYYLNKLNSYYYFVNSDGTRFTKNGIDYNYEFNYESSTGSFTLNTVVTSFNDKSQTLAQVFGEDYTLVLGLEPKMQKLENQIRYDISLFTKKVSDNLYESMIVNDQTNSSKFYIKEQDGKNYLVGIVVGSNYQIKFTFNYAFQEAIENEVSENQTSTFELIYNEAQMPETFMQIEKTYTFNIVTYSDINIPIPIYTQEEFENMTADENYILMNDINLISYKPISTAIASLDGNNFKINIKSFSISNSASGTNVNLGLFDTINENTIIKNVKVVIGNLKTIDVTGYTNINIGFLAVTNNGIITNCSISYETTQNDEVSYLSVINGVEIDLKGATLEIKSNSYINGNETELNLAGLVCENSGVITNSRVGSVDTRISTISENSLLYMQIKAKGNLAGFVLANTGHIASSYVGNIYLINSNPNVSSSTTSGFVGSNTGFISQSYVKGYIDESVINSGDQYHYRSKDGALISNGNIGGFVFNNNGEISDCYSNIKISSNARTAGFVFKNGSNGIIKTSYSSSKVVENSAMHMPFAGVDPNSVVQNEGKFDNCYYLAMANETYESVATSSGIVEIKNINKLDYSQKTFDKEISFNGFSFSIDGEKFRAVWEMQSYGPELVAANDISVSIRYVNESDNTISYTEHPNYRLGTKFNPYLISSAEEFNYYFINDDGLLEDNLIIDNRYFRIIGNINFDEVAGDNITKDLTLSNVTIEGNGFTIENIRINSNMNTKNSEIGLFKTVKSSTIKNLHLKIAEANAINVPVLGGLAGTISNSFVLNIDITTDMVMQGYNVVGGLAGIIDGESYIHSITSSASVQSVYKSSDFNSKPVMYDKENNITSISYAGAIAGVVDLAMSDSVLLEEFQLDSGKNANVKYVQVRGDSSISAEFAGGMFGYVGARTHIFDALFELKYNDSECLQQINSTYVAGGITAVNYGIVNHARIEHNESEQALVENAKKMYLANGQIGNFGKTDLFKGKIIYAGGLVGLNYGGEVKYAYSKVDIIDPNINGDLDYVTEQYFGGLVGVTYSGTIFSAYASGNVVTKASNYSYAGGLVGRVNYLPGLVSEELDEDETVRHVPLTIFEVYAVNYFDIGYAKYAFRNIETINGSTVNTGMLFGYLGDLSNAEYNFSSLSAIKNINFNGKLLFIDETNTKGYLRKLIAYNQNSADIIGDQFLNEIINLNDIYAIDTQTISSVNSFFSELLARVDYWSKESGELPILKFSNVTDEVNIFTAKQLISSIDKYPYKTYKIINDLDFSGIKRYPTSRFTGKIISYKFDENDEIVPVNFLNINFSYSVDNFTDVAFLNSTKRAEFSNINFFVLRIESSKSLDSFAVISTTSEGCNYNNVHVICVNEEITKDNYQALKQDKLSLGTIKINAKLMGGLIAESSGTNIMSSCSFTGNLVNNYEGSEPVYVGGLIATSSGLKLYSNCYFGNKIALNNKIQFGTYYDNFVANEFAFTQELSINIEDVLEIDSSDLNTQTGYLSGDNSKIEVYTTNSSKQLYYVAVGGLVGKNSNIFKVNNANVEDVNSNVNIIVNGKGTYKYVGGIIGDAKDCNNVNMQYVKANVDITVENGEKLEVGGIAGSLSNAQLLDIAVGSSSSLSGIYACATNTNETSKSITSLGGIVGFAQDVIFGSKMSTGNSSISAHTDLKGDANTKLSVGGAIGECANSNANVTNYNIFTFGSINKNVDSIAMTTFIGGIIGNNVLSYSNGNKQIRNTVLNNCYSEIEIYVNSLGKYAYVGGILGSGLTIINSSTGVVLDDVTTSNIKGSLSIESSTAGGKITLYYNKDNSIYAGGVAGQIETGKIKNVTILTHIIKDTYGSNQIENFKLGVVTSEQSGYKGSGIIVDEVTGLKEDTGALIGEETSYAKSNFKAITYAEFLDNFYVLDSVYEYIKSYFRDENETINIDEGSVLNPVKVYNSSDINLNAYNILYDDITINSTLGVFNGVLAGGTYEILDNKNENVNVVKVQSDSAFEKISKTAIISNIAITNLDLNDPDTWVNNSKLDGEEIKCSNGLLAFTNYGILHDIYATGYVSGENVGGLVDINCGLIYNTICDIKVSGIGAIGELSSKSFNGTILNSFTLGEVLSLDKQEEIENIAVGAVVAISSNTLYKYVNSATSVVSNYIDDTKSNVKFNIGFVARSLGIEDELLGEDLFVYCTFDPQTVTRNNLSLSSDNLRALSTLTYASSSNPTTNSNCFILLDSITDITKNYYYPYFKNVKNLIKTTNVYDVDNALTSARINNYTILNLVLHNKKNIGETIDLDNNISQYGFNISGANKTIYKQNWKAVDYCGTFNGNGKIIKGLDITTLIDGEKYYTGFFAHLIQNANATTKIENLTLEVGSIDNKISSTNRNLSSSKVQEKTEYYSGLLAGLIDKGDYSTNIDINNVKVVGLSSEESEKLNIIANKTGSFAGYVKGVRFTNCTNNNIKVKSYNLYNSDSYKNYLFNETNSWHVGYEIEDYKWAYAGGMVGYAEMTTFKNCVNNADVESDNGFDAPSVNNSDGKNGTMAPPVGGYVAYAVGCTFIGSTNGNITIISGHAGNGSDASGHKPTRKDNHTGKTNGYNGFNGGNGGNAYIGYFAGLAYSCSFKDNTSNLDNINFDFIKDSSHSTVAGHGGDGSDGDSYGIGNCPGVNFEGIEPKVTPWPTVLWLKFSGCGGTDDWLHDCPCPNAGEGGNGGNGGNGGKTYFGKLYGATSYNAEYVKTRGTTNKYSSSVGGDGGCGSKGGNGSTLSEFQVFDFVVGWTHYGGDSGKSGTGGSNGNGAKASEPTSNSHNGANGGAQTAKGSHASQQYFIYLQS